MTIIKIILTVLILIMAYLFFKEIHKDNQNF